MRMTGMLRCVLPLLFLVVGSSFSQCAEPSVANQSLVSLLPDGAIATAEFSKLGTLIERIETSAGLKAVLESPQWEDILKQDGVQKAMAGKTIAEGTLRMSLWEFAKTYFGDRIVIGAYPSTPGAQPDAVVIVRVKQAESLKTLWERLSPLIPLAGDKLKVSDYEGGGKLLVAADGNQAVIRDRYVVVSKVKTLLETTLKNLASNPQPDTGLATQPAWKQMFAQMGTDHEAQFCLNMVSINALTGHRLIPAKLDNGLFSLLFGGYLELAATSPYIGSTIDIVDNQVRFRSCAAGDPSQLDAAHKPFVLEGDSAARATLPGVNNRLSGFSLARDFASWYRNREALLEAKLLPGFDKFETGIATFLPGRDFGEDVLPSLGQKLTIVTAPQNFNHLKGKPGVQLPSLAIVLEPAKPAEANDLLTLVFQTITLISNLQAAQEGRQPFVMSSESYRDVQIAFAKYLKLPEGDTLPISANFQPASAKVGNRFVITTNVAMCRQLIDLLQAESTSPASPTPPAPERTGIRDLYFDLSPSIAADLLELNRQVLQAQRLQQGKSVEQATQELNAALSFLRQLAPVTFSSTRFVDRWELEINAGWPQSQAVSEGK